jgi:hypothetical protein
MSVRPVSRSLEEDEGKIVEFFGQLWSVPRTTVPRVSQICPNLFWIHRDRWESRNFDLKDCHPVKVEDILRTDPKEGKFASDF